MIIADKSKKLCFKACEPNVVKSGQCSCYNQGKTLNGVIPRFFVDERNGCVAIRDRTLNDPNDNGCDADKIDVVKFAMGDKIDTGKFITWDIDPKIVQEFRIECALLNEV